MGYAIFDAWSAADEALVNSHWIAGKTAATLAGAVRIEGAEADRAAMERVLGEAAVTGVAFFGHGREDHLRDAAGAPVLDAANLALVGGRWFHGFACLSGKRLAGLARGAGVATYAGYEVRVVVEFTPDRLPPDLTALFVELVTTTTLALAGGCRSGRELRRRVRAVAEDVRAWFDDHAAWVDDDENFRERMGIKTLAEQLERDLFIEGTAAGP
jgi:hypothetical protein